MRAAAANAQTLKLAPSYAPLHIRSGFWHLDLDRRLQARRAFERSIELDPGNPGGYWGLARIMMLDDEPEHAVALLERLLRNRPNDPYTFQLLGNAYRQVGQWQKAQVALGKAKGGGPTWPDPWHQEVHTLRDQSDGRGRAGAGFHCAWHSATSRRRITETATAASGEPNCA